jgi:hypothetical protein
VVRHVALFDVGGEKIANSRLRSTTPTIPTRTVLLGLDYFLSHRIFVSRLQHRVYVTWNGGPVFARDADAKGEYDARFAALPQGVASDDADALARRGSAALAARNHEGALADLNRACALAPERRRLLRVAGEGPPGDAPGRLRARRPRRGAALDPALADARLNRAGCACALDDRPGAQSDLAQLDADVAAGSHLRADMATLHCRDWRRPADAMRQFDLWVRTHPDDEGLRGS